MGQLVKFISLVGVMISSVWVGASPGWESILALIATFSTFATAEVKDQRKIKSLRYHEADLTLFRQFLKLFSSSSGCYTLLDGGDFKTYDGNHLEPAREFLHAWCDAEHEFIDKRLEKKRKEAYTALENFMGKLVVHTFPVKGDRDWFRLDMENLAVGYAKMQEIRLQINSLAYLAYKALQKLERLGRREFSTIGDL